MSLSDKIQVGMVLLGSGPGGAERRCANLFKYLVKIDPESYHLIINYELYEILNQAGYELDRVPNVHFVKIKRTSSLRHKERTQGKSSSSSFSNLVKGQLKTLWIYSQIESLRKTLSLNILHGVWGGVYAITPYFFSKRVSTVISYNDVSFKLLERNPLYLLSSYHLGLRKATQIDLLSNEIKNGLVQRGYNLATERTNIAPCSFIDYNRYKPSNKKEDWVVFAGALRHFKNPLLFVKSIPKVLKEVNDVSFYLLGRGSIENEVQAKIEELKLGDVMKSGWVADTSGIVSKSLIFVSLQSGDNYPSQSLLEAMACENAIVATDVGETWKLVDEEVGFRIPLDPYKIADAIIFLLKNREIAIEMGKNARKKVIKEYTIERYAEYIQNVYRKAYQISHNKVTDANTFE